MRIKEMRLVVAFHTTDAAMAAERRCKAANLPGKLITVPRSSTSDCGIAWAAPAADSEATRSLLEKAQIEVAGYYELML